MKVNSRREQTVIFQDCYETRPTLMVRALCPQNYVSIRFTVHNIRSVPSTIHDLLLKLLVWQVNS